MKAFKETQKTDTIWPLGLLALTLIGNWVLYFKLSFQDISFFYICVGTVSLICLILFALRLHTTIDSQGVAYKLFPFHFKWQTITWDEIKSKEIRTYKPWFEYGGWGLRRGRSGRAYTIKGVNGLQIVMKDGQKILIGTAIPDELSKFITSIK